MLQDIALLTGGKALFEDLAIDLKTVEISDLGTAKTVKVEKENTTIIEGAGKRGDIQGRIKEIRREIENTALTMIVKSCKNAWPSWPVVWP